MPFTNNQISLLSTVMLYIAQITEGMSVKTNISDKYCIVILYFLYWLENRKNALCSYY